MGNIYLHVRSLGRRFVIYEQIPLKKYVVNICGEFIGTFILVFLGCLSEAVRLPHLDVTLTFGFAVMVAVQCFAHLSGSHINPPVSLASFILGYLSLANLPIYMAAQLLGGIAGHGMTWILTSDEIQSDYRSAKGIGPCTPFKHPTLQAWQVFLCEFMLTFILIMVCGAVWDWRNKARHDSVSIRFGIVIGVLAIAGGAVSGANMNPARTFGPCLNNGDFLDYHWVLQVFYQARYHFEQMLIILYQAYWAGPFLAGFAGGFLYRLIFDTPEPGVDDVVPDEKL